MSDSAPKPGRSNALLDRLYSEFPVFRDHRPLAIGIHKALILRLPDLDKGQVRNALHLHTGSTRYLKSIVENAPRFDLDNTPDGVVTAEQHKQAATTLRERFRKAAERRKADEDEKKRQAKLLSLAEKFNSR